MGRRSGDLLKCCGDVHNERWGEGKRKSEASTGVGLKVWRFEIRRFADGSQICLPAHRHSVILLRCRRYRRQITWRNSVIMCGEFCDDARAHREGSASEASIKASLEFRQSRTDRLGIPWNWLNKRSKTAEWYRPAEPIVCGIMWLGCHVYVCESWGSRLCLEKCKHHYVLVHCVNLWSKKCVF